MGYLEKDELRELVTLKNHWPTLSYENLLEKKGNNEKHGLLDVVSLALWCKLQL